MNPDQRKNSASADLRQKFFFGKLPVLLSLISAILYFIKSEGILNFALFVASALKHAAGMMK